MTDSLDKQMEDATKDLAQSQAIIQTLLKNPSPFLPTEEEEDTGDATDAFQLILQYRLDTQEALTMLLQVDHSLLHVLGIDRHHSALLNFERMRFALGKDDLQYVLHTLSRLLHALQKVSQRTLKQKTATFQKKHDKTSSKYVRDQFIDRLQKAITLQHGCQVVFKKMEVTIKELLRLQATSPVLDNIAALRGPISQFYQALQNGLEPTYQLYKTVLQAIPGQLRLSHVLNNTNAVLKQWPTLSPRPFLSPLPDSKTAQLNARATVKRLGHFFRN